MWDDQSIIILVETWNHKKYINKIEITPLVWQLIVNDDEIKEIKQQEGEIKDIIFKNVVGIIRKHKSSTMKLFKEIQEKIYSIEDERIFSLQFEAGKRYLELKKERKPNGQHVYVAKYWGNLY